MTEPRDDQLAAMLEARADRLPPAADREVMAAVRAEIRIPKGGALFSVVPVTRTRAMSGPAGWAAVGLVAVLVLAVVGGGRLDSKPSTPAGSGPGSGSPAPSLDATGGPAATAMAPAVNTITVGELRAGLDDASLNGRIVLLTGSLRVTEFRCFTPQACGSIEIVGLEGVEVSDRWGTWSAEAVLATVNAHPGDSLMAFRVHVSGLELLGWPQQDPAAPMTVARLAAGIPGIWGDDLAIVSGWLGPWLVSCDPPSPSSGAVNCRNMRPALADGTTGSSGTEIGEAVEVTVAAGSRIGDAFLRGLEGPFLVRHNAYRGGSLPPYEVVASLNPSDIVRVETKPSSMAMTAEQFQGALEDGSLDGKLIAVTGWLQPSGALCPADVPQPCTLFVILGLDIGMTWDGPVSTVNRLLVQRPPSTTASTLLVTQRDGHLVLLGRLSGNLEQPASIQQLTDGRLLSARRDPLALTAVAGWLVAGGIQSCRAPAPDATPCPGPDPLLTDVEPSPDGRMTNYDRQQPVRVWPGAVGIDPAQVVTPGPFLYRTAVGSTCDGLDRSEGWTCAGGPISAWEVMARYDIGSVYRVVVP